MRTWLKEIWNKTGSSATLSKFDYDYDVLGRIKQWTQQTDFNTSKVMIMDNDAEDQLLNAAIMPQGCYRDEPVVTVNGCTANVMPNPASAAHQEF